MSINVAMWTLFLSLYASRITPFSLLTLSPIAMLRGIYFIELSKMRGENWKGLWQRPCRAKGKLKLAPRRWLQSRKLHPKRFQKRCMAVCGIPPTPESTRQRGKSSRPTKTQRSHCRQCSFYNLVHKFILCHKRRKFRMQRMEKLETIPASSIIEFGLLVVPFLFVSILSGFTTFCPYSWPHRIWSGLSFG